MEKIQELKKRISIWNDQKPKLGVEIHNRKIIPNLRNQFTQLQAPFKNEWEQEYYIIYNSYVLEEKDF